MEALGIDEQARVRDNAPDTAKRAWLRLLHLVPSMESERLKLDKSSIDPVLFPGRNSNDRVNNQLEGLQTFDDFIRKSPLWWNIEDFDHLRANSDINHKEFPASRTAFLDGGGAFIPAVRTCRGRRDVIVQIVSHDSTGNQSSSNNLHPTVFSSLFLAHHYKSCFHTSVKRRHVTEWEDKAQAPPDVTSLLLAEDSSFLYDYLFHPHRLTFNRIVDEFGGFDPAKLCRLSLDATTAASSGQEIRKLLAKHRSGIVPHFTITHAFSRAVLRDDGLVSFREAFVDENEKQQLEERRGDSRFSTALNIIGHRRDPIDGQDYLLMQSAWKRPQFFEVTLDFLRAHCGDKEIVFIPDHLYANEGTVRVKTHSEDVASWVLFERFDEVASAY